MIALKYAEFKKQCDSVTKKEVGETLSVEYLDKCISSMHNKMDHCRCLVNTVTGFVHAEDVEDFMHHTASASEIEKLLKVVKDVKSKLGGAAVAVDALEHFKVCEWWRKRN